jgi:hypothetical protein
MNNPVKIIDKACMSYIIDHQKEKSGMESEKRGKDA